VSKHSPAGAAVFATDPAMHAIRVSGSTSNDGITTVNTLGAGGMAWRERRCGLILAMALAGLAGMVDAIGYIRLQNLFVSFMSGNTTQLAVAIGHSRFAEAQPILMLIPVFVLGAAGGQLLAHATGRRHLTAVLVSVTILLVLAAVFDTAPLPMVLAMGGLNAAMHRAGDVPVSLTYVTGTLVKFGQGLADFVTGRAKGWAWAEQALPWIGLLAGGIIAAAAQHRVGAAVDWLPVGMAAVLAGASVVIPPPE
jgi:uncharacterized membrane protein YoaK (UPF0700 family)